MSYCLFQKVFATVTAHSLSLRQGSQPDFFGRVGISPLIKVICTMRQLPYERLSNLEDDLFDVSETTSSRCLEAFCQSVTSCFGYIYLPSPNQDDLVKIEKRFREAGFTGFIGCLCCARWTWKLPCCITGHNERQRWSAICLHRSHLRLGPVGMVLSVRDAGSFNDLNVLEVSSHFHDVLAGVFLPHNLLSRSRQKFLHGSLI